MTHGRAFFMIVTYDCDLGLATWTDPLVRWMPGLFPECISESETKCEIGRLVSIRRPWLPVVLEMMTHARLDI